MKNARKKAKPVPKGYGTVTPYLACGDAARAIDFYKEGVRRECRWPNCASAAPRQ